VLTETPKPCWSGVDLLAPLRVFGRPIVLATDVQGAGLAESRWGAASGCRTLAYVTVGTGIGGALLAEGAPIDDVRHPEMGHVRVPRAADDRLFPGVCRIHGDCLEGLASGPAIAARWGAPLEELGPEHPARELEAFYLAQLCATLLLVVAPERIVLGGGVMSGGTMVPAIRRRTAELLAGYPRRASVEALATLLRPAALGARAGSLGALALAATIR